MNLERSAELYMAWEENRISEQDLLALTELLERDADARQTFIEETLISETCVEHFREEYLKISASSPTPFPAKAVHRSSPDPLPLVAAGLLAGAALWVLFAILAVPGKPLDVARLAPRTVAGDGDAKEVEAHLRELVAKLSADEAEARDAAEHQLEAYVRQTGVSAFRILEGEVLPSVKDNLEAKMRVNKVIERLSKCEVVWSVMTGSCSFAPGAPGLNEALGVFVQPTSNGLFAIEAATGKVLWSKPGDYQHSTPVVRSDAVYALLPPQSVAAYDPRSGKERWTFELPFSMDESLAYDEQSDLVLASTRGGILVALDRQGKEAWRTERLLANWELNGQMYSSGSLINPAVDEGTGRIFTGIWSHNLVALDRENGKKIWESPLSGVGFNAPVVCGGRLYTSGYTSTGQGQSIGFVSCLDANTGKSVWAAKLPGTELIGQPLIGAAEHTLVCQGKTALYALDLTSGELRWQVPMERFGYTSSTLKDGVLYAGADDARISAVLIANGKLLWTREFDSDPISSGANTVHQSDASGVRRATLGAMGQPRFSGDLLICSTVSGLTFALRVPPFHVFTLSSGK